MRVDDLIDNLTMMKVHNQITGDTEIAFSDNRKCLSIDGLFNSIYKDKVCLVHMEGEK